MEDLVEDLARGNVTEVKVVLASIVLALALYQVALMSSATARSEFRSSAHALLLSPIAPSAMPSS